MLILQRGGRSCAAEPPLGNMAAIHPPSLNRSPPRGGAAECRAATRKGHVGQKERGEEGVRKQSGGSKEGSNTHMLAVENVGTVHLVTDESFFVAQSSAPLTTSRGRRRWGGGGGGGGVVSGTKLTSMQTDV